MTPHGHESPELARADVELSTGGWTFRAHLSVPTGLARPSELLPLAQSLADAVVDVAVREARAQGHEVTCKKGCAACCRQLVMLSEMEAHAIARLVNDLPEPRRSQVRSRFSEARHRLAEAGLSEPLRQREQWSEPERRAICSKYFSLQIPCPFLEEECCSIYPMRPLVCREYLVTSPAEMCALPTAVEQRVRIPLPVFTAVARFTQAPPPARFVRWVPLITALDWVDAHPDELPPRSGPELLGELVQGLAPEESVLPAVGRAS